jgi:hypothetical protein
MKGQTKFLQTRHETYIKQLLSSNKRHKKAMKRQTWSWMWSFHIYFSKSSKVFVRGHKISVRGMPYDWLHNMQLLIIGTC